ncbi:MAG: hypothetical protein ACPGVZ_08345 [Myxococcota bacterium]
MAHFDPKLRESYVPLSGGVRSFLMGELQGSCVFVKSQREPIGDSPESFSLQTLRVASPLDAGDGLPAG